MVDGLSTGRPLTDHQRVQRGEQLARELIVAARVRGVEEAEDAIEAAAEARNPARSMRVFEVDSLVSPHRAEASAPRFLDVG